MIYGMRFERLSITADLGTGAFRVRRYVKTLVNRLSELPIADGYIDRVIVGCDVTHLLEGEYDTAADGGFFEELSGQLASAGAVGAVIDGRECPELAAVKVSLMRSEDSRIGSFTIILKEL